MEHRTDLIRDRVIVLSYGHAAELLALITVW